MASGKLEEVTGVGKRVTIRDKATGQLIDVGLVHDEVSVLLDGDNKYFIQLIRGDHGDLYRIGYYTTRRDGRLCLGSQYCPIMNPEEFKALLDKAREKDWPQAFL